MDALYQDHPLVKSVHVPVVKSIWYWFSAMTTPSSRTISAGAVLETRAAFFSVLASSLAMALAAVARTVFLPSAGRNSGSLQDVCASTIGLSSIRCVVYSRRGTGVVLLSDHACWTLTEAAVLKDKYDDRIYFADPASLTLSLSMSPVRKRGLRPASRRSTTCSITKETDYRLYDCP